EEAFKGIGLADKTDILSGTEIYTDKADDDSVVHVEVDGKSYQPTAENLYSKDNSTKGRYYNTDGSIVVASNHHEIMEEYFPISMGDIVIEQLWNPNGTINAGSQNRIVFYDSNKTVLSVVNGIVLNGNAYQEKKHTAPERASLFRFGSITGVGGARDDDIEVSFSINYPSAPTPDYPVEIHSLNDFDVVSSVGKRNLLEGTRNLSGFWGTGYNGAVLKYETVDMRKEWNIPEATRIVTTTPSAGGTTAVLTTANRMTMEFGKEYTYSLLLKNNSTKGMYINTNGLTGASNPSFEPGETSMVSG